LSEALRILGHGRSGEEEKPGQTPGETPDEGRPIGGDTTTLKAGDATPGLPRATEAPEPPPLEPILQGRWVETSRGRAFLREIVLPLDHAHGRTHLGSPLEISAEAASAILPGGLRPEDMAYLDIETTGLSGGTGTYAFLVGLGGFEDGRYRLRQYFLPDLDAEGPMLTLLGEDLARFRGLATYNGRSFDVPILEARMTLARMPIPWKTLPHVDILHAVRRLWRHRLPTCRMSDAETGLLGLERTGDVPGALIPSLYFDYIRAGRVAPLRAVLRHNALDVVSISAVLGLVGRLLSDPNPDAPDALSIARWWDLAGKAERAEGFYRRAVEGLSETKPWTMAAERYAQIRKRAGARREVVELWRRIWTLGSPEAGLEVAKYLEHEAADLAEAESVTRKLLAVAAPPDRAALEHRLARLVRKRASAGGGPPPKPTERR
jgi:uncharacterized protein YprB with RNaseH-like and TPR domain